MYCSRFSFNNTCAICAIGFLLLFLLLLLSLCCRHMHNVHTYVVSKRSFYGSRLEFFFFCVALSPGIAWSLRASEQSTFYAQSQLCTHTHTTYISINWTIAYSHHYGRWSGIFYSCGDANHIHPMRFISGAQERITEQTTGTKCIITFYIQAQFMTIRSASHAKLDDYCHPQPTSSLLYSIHSPLTCALDFDCFFLLLSWDRVSRYRTNYHPHFQWPPSLFCF